MRESDVERSLKYVRRKNRKANIARGYVPLSQALQNESRPAGWKSLAMAVVEQAVIDYFLLHRNGYIKELTYTGKPFDLQHGSQRRVHVQGLYKESLDDLLDFWKTSRCMKYLNLAMYEDKYLEITESMIRKGLLTMERVGNIHSRGRAIP